MVGKYWALYDACPSCNAKPGKPCVSIKAQATVSNVKKAHVGRERVPSQPPRHNDLDLTFPALGDVNSCSEEQMQAAARVARRYIKTLPTKDQDLAWGEIAGALGIQAFG